MRRFIGDRVFLSILFLSVFCTGSIGQDKHSGSTVQTTTNSRPLADDNNLAQIHYFTIHALWYKHDQDLIEAAEKLGCQIALDYDENSAHWTTTLRPNIEKDFFLDFVVYSDSKEKLAGCKKTIYDIVSTTQKGVKTFGEATMMYGPYGSLKKNTLILSLKSPKYS